MARRCCAATFGTSDASLALGLAAAGALAGGLTGPSVAGAEAMAVGGLALVDGAGVEAQPPIAMLTRTAHASRCLTVGRFYGTPGWTPRPASGQGVVKPSIQV